MNQRIILHLDLDYFFAQIEEVRNTSLKGKPVVVCVYSGRTADSGAVSTANYAARKIGIKSGMPIAFAKKNATPETVFLPVDHEFYSQVSQRIMELASKFAERFEQASIDEAYLDVTQKVHGKFEEARQIALQIKKEVFEKEKLTLSIGIGPNKLIAKIACGQNKPDGLTVVEPQKVKEFLSPLGVSEILGVGTKTNEKLNAMKIFKISELAETSKLNLIKAFGNAKGEYLHNAAQGIDESEIEENWQRQQISRIATLKKDTGTFEEIAPTIKELSKEVADRLNEEKLFFKTTGMIAVTGELKTHSKSKTLNSFTNSLAELEETALELLKDFLKENPKAKIRRIGVRASNFGEENRQKTLSEF